MANLAGKPAPAAVAAREGQRGNIIVELALVLPLFLLILAGILDLGMLFWEKHILTTATREGARAAVKANSNGTAVLTKAQAISVAVGYLYNFHLKGATGELLVTQASPPPNDSYTLNEGSSNYTIVSGTPAQVTVELKDIPVPLMLLPNIQGWFGGGGWGSNTYYLNARTTMAAEWTTPPG